MLKIILELIMDYGMYALRYLVIIVLELQRYRENRYRKLRLSLMIDLCIC